MTEFVSDTKTIPCNDDRIFGMLSDLSNLERLKDRIPPNNVRDVSFDSDSCSFVLERTGKISFRIVEREPNKMIKLTADISPVSLDMWIQLKQVAENNTHLRLTIRTELNPFLKPMVSKPLQDALDKISDILVSLPY
ncbi:MAG: SRPBCC family protein [Tannerellaceae bacterium]|jgi:hypothetical protein|nr:SRPBCC family protein [Tannerellaceae bacterium]